MCFGVCDGSVGSSGAGGTTTYTYSWDGGLGIGQNITGVVCAGTYNVTVTDANGRIVTGSVDVLPTVVTSSITNIINVTCNGFSDGSAEVSLSGAV